MEINRYTPVPPISTSAAETDSNEDSGLKEEMEEWKQRIETLKDEKNYEHVVTDNSEFCIFCSAFCHVTFIKLNKYYYKNKRRDHRRMTSVNFRGHDIFARKICMKKVNKMREFYMILDRKLIRIP